MDAILLIRPARNGQGIVLSLRMYLRKTARGASSPAKPALHIPELEDVSKEF